MASSVSFMVDDEPKGRYGPPRASYSDRFPGRSQSAGRYDSDRSIEDVIVSDALKYGRGGRVYERPDGFRRPPSARSQSLGRLEAERYMEERYGPRFYDEPSFVVERYPRDCYDDRYMRDMHEDRMVRDMHMDRFAPRPSYEDRFFNNDRYTQERPPTERFPREDRFSYDRYPVVVVDRPVPERMPERFHERFDANDRFDRHYNRERLHADSRHPEQQRYGNDRDRFDRGERFGAERYDRHTSYEKHGKPQMPEKYAAERRSQERPSEKQSTDRYAADRSTGEPRPVTTDKPVSDRYRISETANTERDEKFSNDRASTERGSNDRFPAANGERFQKF